MPEQKSTEDTFKKSVAQRKGQQLFSVLGSPQHCGNLAPSMVNDAVARYKIMRGYYVSKRDCRATDQDYTESVMWAFKQLYQKNLIYEAERVVPYSYGAQTALSDFEVQADGTYRDRQDIAATIRFKLEDGRYLLGWAPTPWTLPANLLLAVGSDIDYVEVEDEGEKYIVAEAALERYPELDDAEVVRRMKGHKLVGLHYEPLFDYFVSTQGAFRVVAANFVTLQDGTGIMHVAPGHRSVDFWLGQRESVPIISPVDDTGRFTVEVRDYASRLVLDANNEIIADLDTQKKLFKSAIYNHKYPHCPATGVPIIYRLVRAWFVDVPKIKDDLLAVNQRINWLPASVKNTWLKDIRDWNIGRTHSRGTPIPVWKTDDGELIVPGSLKELKEMAVNPDNVTDLHRPFIDKVVLKTKDGKLARRVESVLDCWFEAGCMPFADLHYPFRHKKRFESGLTADFIAAPISRARGWFYALLVVQVALFDTRPFKSCQAGSDDLLGDTQRAVIRRFKNMYRFFAEQVKANEWRPAKKLVVPKSHNILDIWMLARLSRAVQEITEYADAYEVSKIMKALADLLDDTFNWFVRCSRRRFTGSDAADKNSAYATLHYTIIRFSQLFAPWAPVVADDIWRRAAKGTNLPKSVHLSDWPQAGSIHQKVLTDMQKVRSIIAKGLTGRARAKIKAGEPATSATVPKLPAGYRDIIADALNAKKVIFGHKASAPVIIKI